MATTPLQQLNEHGQSVWVDYLSRTFIEDGELAGLVARRRPRRHLQPHDLPGRDRRGRRLRRAAQGGARDARASRRRSSWRSPSATSRPPATCCARVHDSRARTAGSRSRSTRTSPTTPRARSTRPSACRSSSTSPNLFVKIPATKEGLPAIEEPIAAGIPINVTLIFSLERHREVAEAYVRGAPATRRERRRPDQDRLGRLVLRLARRHRGRQAARRDRRPRRVLKGKLAIANARAGLPDLQGALLGLRLGGAGREGRDARSAACGRRPRPRTPTTATSSTSRS